MFAWRPDGDDTCTARSGCRVVCRPDMFTLFLISAPDTGGLKSVAKRSDGPGSGAAVGLLAAQCHPVRRGLGRQPGHQPGSRATHHGGVGDEEHGAGGKHRT